MIYTWFTFQSSWSTAPKQNQWKSVPGLRSVGSSLVNYYKRIKVTFANISHRSYITLLLRPPVDLRNMFWILRRYVNYFKLYFSVRSHEEFGLSTWQHYLLQYFAPNWVFRSGLHCLQLVTKHISDENGAISVESPSTNGENLLLLVLTCITY